MAQVHIGTLIHGTLRDEDLLEAFADELERLDPNNEMHGLLVLEARSLATHDNVAVRDNDAYTASDVVNDLIDALNEYAPPHTYFGTLEGDGSDFGFWPIEDVFCDMVQLNAVDHVCIDHQVIVSVNDHGNVTVSELRGPELWSTV